MLLERILSRENMIEALKRVKSNKGSHGIDGMKIEELSDYLKSNWIEIKEKIMTGKYKPQPVRRVEIPKHDGGVRLLGIPTVLDRLIQQAIYQELELIFEPIFSINSYGFRKQRSAKQAVMKSKAYIEEGCTWVIDIDLEKFFDKVNHNILMVRISRKVSDERVLKLIGKYLKSGVMINGTMTATEEGT